jgi:hypothetical protein
VLTIATNPHRASPTATQQDAAAATAARSHCHQHPLTHRPQRGHTDASPMLAPAPAPAVTICGDSGGGGGGRPGWVTAVVVLHEGFKGACALAGLYFMACLLWSGRAAPLLW